MDIVILSGKGGTGKTTVATNLSKVLNIAYIDCDVEEPNGHIFLKPQNISESNVGILNPVIDMDKCTLCSKCVEACQFNALAIIGSKVNLFSELCHGCGACSIVCQFDAINEVSRTIGKVLTGDSNGIPYMGGILNIKEPMSGPIISSLKNMSKLNVDNIFDASPGTSCNVVKAIDGCDYAILVTEPTKFGLHDLKLAVELIEDINIPFGIILNRSTSHNTITQEYCKSKNLDLIGEIPFSIKAANLYSKGELLINSPDYESVFNKIGDKILETLKRRTTSGISGN